MRRFVPSVLAVCVIITACDTAPVEVDASAWGRITADERFWCFSRRVEEDGRQAMLRSQFACEYRDSYRAAVWVDRYNGATWYTVPVWVADREVVIQALDDAVDLTDDQQATLVRLGEVEVSET